MGVLRLHQAALLEGIPSKPAAHEGPQEAGPAPIPQNLLMCDTLHL